MIFNLVTPLPRIFKIIFFSVLGWVLITISQHSMAENKGAQTTQGKLKFVKSLEEFFNLCKKNEQQFLLISSENCSTCRVVEPGIAKSTCSFKDNTFYGIQVESQPSLLSDLQALWGVTIVGTPALLSFPKGCNELPGEKLMVSGTSQEKIRAQQNIVTLAGKSFNVYVQKLSEMADQYSHTREAQNCKTNLKEDEMWRDRLAPYTHPNYSLFSNRTSRPSEEEIISSIPAVRNPFTSTEEQKLFLEFSLHSQQEFWPQTGHGKGPEEIHVYNPNIRAGLFNLMKEVYYTPQALSREAKELVAVSTSKTNGCQYCSTSHIVFLSVYTHSGKENGLIELLSQINVNDPEAVDRLVHFPTLESVGSGDSSVSESNDVPQGITKEQKAYILLGLNNRRQISPELLKEYVRPYLTPAQVVEALGTEFLFNYFNRMVDVFIGPNFQDPPQEMLDKMTPVMRALKLSPSGSYLNFPEIKGLSEVQLLSPKSYPWAEAAGESHAQKSILRFAQIIEHEMLSLVHPNKEIESPISPKVLQFLSHEFSHWDPAIETRQSRRDYLERIKEQLHSQGASAKDGAERQDKWSEEDIHLVQLGITIARAAYDVEAKDFTPQSLPQFYGPDKALNSRALVTFVAWVTMKAATRILEVQYQTIYKD